MKRTVWFWAYFIVAIILAVYFATRIVMTSFGHSPLSIIRNISISADSADKDLSAIAAAVAVAPGTHTYSLNLDTMNARIAAVPGVKKSAVRRKPDGNLSVKVQLYRAIALWTDGSHYYPLSDDGTIVRKPSSERTAGTVLFRGPVPNNIDEITKVAHNLIGDLDYMEWIEDRRWNLHTTGGITVLLPENDPVSAIGTLLILNKNHQILAKKITIIDMRDSARILVK